ncbi:MAG: hypothetical protein LBC74_01255 [Planctomycetaceae bacterium]|nr:hypothetical protein [Planctomycetaceae bacterium]
MGNKKTPTREANYSPPSEGSGVVSYRLAKKSNKNVIVGDSNQCIPKATLYEFGILTSSIHNAWMRYVCGRLKSDYRYSASIVYNNFVWAENITGKQKLQIEKYAQQILDIRKKYSDNSLADLYDSLTMPRDLLKAHQEIGQSC